MIHVSISLSVLTADCGISVTIQESWHFLSPI